MSDDRDERRTTRHGPGQHLGPARTSPYPQSRLAPVHELVDTARQIAEADRLLGTVVSSKLQVIVDRIASLQAQAREILEQARIDAEIHRAQCRFTKRVGQTYHLYRRDDGATWLSMIDPAQWHREPPGEYLGSYRLEPDMSWRAAHAAGPRPLAELRAAVGLVDDE